MIRIAPMPMIPQIQAGVTPSVALVITTVVVVGVVVVTVVVSQTGSCR